MRTVEEVLAFIDEQLWYLEKTAQDKGLKRPLLAKIETQASQDSLDQKYWLYQSLKWFINKEI